MKKKNEEGYTIIELAIAVGIISILIMGVLKFVPALMSDTKTNENISLIQSIISKSRGFYQTKSDTSSLTTQLAIDFEMVPASMATGTNIINGWGGTITFAPGTITTANDSMVVTFSQVPSSECRNVSLKIDESVASISVDGVVVKAAGGAMVDGTLSTNCNDSNANTLAITYAK